MSKYIFRMGLFLVTIVLFFFYNIEKIKVFFLTNSNLNGLICFFLIFGIVLMFRQVINLFPELEWINSYISEKNKKTTSVKKPKLLKPIAQIMKSQTGTLKLSQTGMRQILESIEIRLLESREISRYFISLLVFLGLLGTFWGLLETINSVGITIKGLDFSAETEKLFLVLKDGLEKPLSGMGTAFSSSLFGLGGSLILGFLDLQSSQAQNRFYNEIEEKLAFFTKLSSHSDSSQLSNDFAPAYIESLIETTTENLKKSSAGIEQQSINQEIIAKSLSEINHFLNNSISINKEIKDEIKVLSKTIANTSKK
ncbi:MAG: flagellar motor protein MotA [Rickettsiales bacterium]|nr:flagellar motor protein MotA [Rickettsiales bacterium]